MIVQVVRFVGKLPYAARPIRGQNGNKRQRRKYAKRVQERKAVAADCRKFLKIDLDTRLSSAQI